MWYFLFSINWTDLNFKKNLLHQWNHWLMDLSLHEHRIYYHRQLRQAKDSQKCLYNISKHSMSHIFLNIHRKTRKLVWSVYINDCLLLRWLNQGIWLYMPKVVEKFIHYWTLDQRNLLKIDSWHEVYRHHF